MKPKRNLGAHVRARGVPQCSLRARGGSSPCSPCSRPKPGAARGCARVRSRRQAAPPLPSAAHRAVGRMSGRRASRHNDAPGGPAGPGVEQKADKQGATRLPPSCPAASMGQKAAQEAAEAVPGIGRLPTTSKRPKGLLRPPERLAAGRPAPGRAAGSAGASLPLVAPQDAAGKARTGKPRPGIVRSSSGLCMGVPCASAAGFRSQQTKAPLVWVKSLSRCSASPPCPACGSCRSTAPGQETGPGMRVNTCASTCDTPPLSGHLVCKRTLPVPYGARVGLSWG